MDDRLLQRVGVQAHVAVEQIRPLVAYLGQPEFNGGIEAERLLGKIPFSRMETSHQIRVEGFGGAVDHDDDLARLVQITQRLVQGGQGLPEDFGRPSFRDQHR